MSNSLSNTDWTMKPVDPDWLNKLTPQERAMLELMQASEELISKWVRMYRDLVMQEFPESAINYVVDAKGVRVEIGVFDWRRELTKKFQPTKDHYAPQLLGTTLRWCDNDTPQIKQRTICEAWMSAFGKTKLADQLYKAVLTGQTVEQFVATKGWIQ